MISNVMGKMRPDFIGKPSIDPKITFYGKYTRFFVGGGNGCVTIGRPIGMIKQTKREEQV